MQRFMTGIVILVLALASQARAAILDEGRIELRPPAVTIERLEPNELEWRKLAARIPVEHVPTHFTRCWLDDDDARAPIQFALPEVGPDTLDLTIRYYSLVFSVCADMSQTAHVSLSPRLECDTRECYFWCRLHYEANEHWSVFVESFQAAGMILGWDTTRAYQAYVWDGYQLEAGLHWQVNDRFSVEGGPILYAFSATHRPNEVGARLGIRLDF